jgi:hypothetical protein
VSGFESVHNIQVPRGVADSGQHFLRSAGDAGREGMVLWIGVQNGATFHVSDALVPRQRGIRTADGVCVVVDGDELHRINVELYKSSRRLIGQVHSHPGRAYHSNTDNEYAIATTIGNISIVVPDFAKRRFLLEECALYRLDRNGRWRALSRRQANALITVVDS